MIEILEMTEADVPIVSRIEEETFSMPWSAKDFLEMIQCEYAYYVVAKEADEILGCCGIRNMCGDGEITNVVVKDACRRKGIGEIMVRGLMEQSRELGVRNYTLEVRESNHAAICLYEKLGFTVEGRRKNFYERPREDALIMWKREEPVQGIRG